jgi:hypothetical protein
LKKKCGGREKLVGLMISIFEIGKGKFEKLKLCFGFWIYLVVLVLFGFGISTLIDKKVECRGRDSTNPFPYN